MASVRGGTLLRPLARAKPSFDEEFVDILNGVTFEYPLDSGVRAGVRAHG